MHILVTGGSRGLGKALVQSLLVYNDNPFEENIESVDITSRQKPETLDPFTTWYRWDQSGPPPDSIPWENYDAVIFNAGIAFDGVLPGLTMEQVVKMVQVNLTSAMLGTSFYIRKRLAIQESGNIIYISSLAAEHGFAGLSVYGGTKSGLLGFMRGVAREWGSKGWRANAICPGYLETDMTASLSTEAKQLIQRRTPLRRLGTTQDVIPLIAFLLSDKASWITGQAFTIDGGLTC